MAELNRDDGWARGRPSSLRKALIETRRRSWVVILSIVLVGAVTWGVTTVISRSYTAESILVVRAGGPLAAQPDASTKLAATYATLIPLDTGVQEAVERSLPDQRNSSFTASNDANTALLRANYKAPNAGLAIAGARAVARAISGGKPASASIAPNTIAIVRLPSRATGSASTPAEIVLVGAVLGLLLGLILVAFWRSRDIRIDDVRELRQQLRCPCFDVGARSSTGLSTLAETLASTSGIISILPSTPRDQHAESRLLEQLVKIAPGERFLSAGPPGSEQAGELTAVAADSLLLVVSTGARAAELDEAVDILERYGVTPSYAALVGRRIPSLSPSTTPVDEVSISTSRPTG